MRRVGSTTGANSGEWLDGRPSTTALASAIDVTFANSAGSAPPSSQYAQGAPAALASRPTSSLPVTGPGSSTRPGPMPSAKASASRAHAPGSLTTTGNDCVTVISGSAGAAAAAASARTMRSIAASVFARTDSSKVRTDSRSSAWSGMTFSTVPACSAPTVTTALSAGATSLDTIVWSRSTVAAAITTGSTVVSGREPWPPCPCSTTRSASEAANAGPARRPSSPAGIGETCWPSTTPGTPNRSNRPSSIMARAPSPVSSAGDRKSVV